MAGKSPRRSGKRKSIRRKGKSPKSRRSSGKRTSRTRKSPKRSSCSKTVDQLKRQAKREGYSGYSKMKKSQLCRLVSGKGKSPKRSAKKTSTKKSSGRSRRKRSSPSQAYLGKADTGRSYVLNLSNCIEKFSMDRVRELANQFYVSPGTKKEMCSAISKAMTENKAAIKEAKDVLSEESDMFGGLFDNPAKITKKQADEFTMVDWDSDADEYRQSRRKPRRLQRSGSIEY